MSSSLPIQDDFEVCPDGQEPDNISATDRDGSVNTPSNPKLRAELKRHYYQKKEALFGQDIKHYWKSDTCMLRVVGLKPMVSQHMDQHLRQLCNKPTMLYWELSAQSPDTRPCLGMVFACIYKYWFLCHDNNPDMDSGKFFAHPFQITPTGPQTIPEILEAHAYLCDRTASQLQSLKSGDAFVRSRWQHVHLLPLCRAIIVLLDKHLSPPVRKSDGTLSLDDEVQRQTAVLVLTGYDQDLSSAPNFDTIRSESLPLARHDVSATDSANVIRVSLKTAVHFISELQQREERASSCSNFAAVNKADQFVEDILDNPSKSCSKWSTIQSAIGFMKARERGEVIGEDKFLHWNGSWV